MSDIKIRSSQIAAYLLRGDGRKRLTLLMKRSRPPLQETWSHVAGEINPGETAWSAALRKIREETGVAPERLYSADICEQFYEPDADRMVLVPVFVAFVSEDASVTPGEAYGELAWCSLEQACDRLVFPAQRRIVRWIWAEFVEREPPAWLAIDIPPTPGR